MKKFIFFRFILLIKFIIFLILIIHLFKIIFKKKIIYLKSLNLYEFKMSNNSLLIEKIKSDYNNNTFAIIKDTCKTCGLFAYYIHYLGCIKTYTSEGYIPIIDLQSFPNVFNGFRINYTDKNPWELFFYQPYGFEIKKVLNYSKNIHYFTCKHFYNNYPHHHIYVNNILLDLWHNIALKYIPIKNEIIIEVDNIRSQLFKGSNNVLGILARGTDYLTTKPKKHPIPPNSKLMIKDIKEMHNKNNYDLFFITTEDELIREEFIKEFHNKLKYFKSKQNIIYNYRNKKVLSINEDIKGNFNYMKIYLVNIIILSKCLDIITARTSGSIGAFVLTNGFRNIKVYYLGEYK